MVKHGESKIGRTTLKELNVRIGFTTIKSFVLSHGTTLKTSPTQLHLAVFKYGFQGKYYIYKT